MTSNYVIVSIKLCLEVGNDEYIIFGHFGDCRVSGLAVHLSFKDRIRPFRISTTNLFGYPVR